ncbi:acidic fibroblast growth factor intracellular-binding protein [Lingula anatina]|uniref:Acidic fibroblast growth factor intracellular-binding protein n=1 Tax=Lingula anatina TaxID=7574 RepID=A0A1S3IA64_LINAN|nr:acidic fibroblast growth factor intracellular-binding protein [Lingula anatina]|eukprot:XP_013394299.1 acidic fibroblast growth factor intracellular-binding protein [Lingula anatina]
MGEVNIFVGNDTLIDTDIYELWLKGYTAHEAAVVQQQKGILQQYGATFEMLFSDTVDHYRTFSMLERFYKYPSKLIDTPVFQINPETKKMLIERYYEFDPEVVREFLGKKLSSRNRKDLDDISEKTRVSLKSCRRQFDNVKHVFKTVEDMMGSLVENIRTLFLISEELAKKYAAIVFIANNRFETGKKKLHYLTFEDFAFCADQMMSHWTSRARGVKTLTSEDIDTDLDRDFLQALRDVKELSDYVEEHKSLVLRTLTGLSDRAFTDIEQNFKNISKVIVGIGSGLSHSKESRDLFLDLVEKFIEPCRQAMWTKDDVEAFLNAYLDTSHMVEHFRSNPQMAKIWDRYMVMITACIVQMYHK